MKRSYDFATIGFRPHSETEEFVTIGVLALDQKAREFGFALLETRKTRRVGEMFPASKELYREARKRLEAELGALKKAVNGEGRGLDVPIFTSMQSGRGLFESITNPREGVICYPVKGRRLANDMTGVLDDLRKRFVERHLEPPSKPVEQEMTRQIADLLKEARILSPYKRDAKVGPEEFKVFFSFAHMTGTDRADRVLRPLNFDLSTTTDIYNHGDEWITRLRRLERLDYKPAQSLFFLRAPKEIGTLRRKAFDEIQREFQESGFIAPNEEDNDRIIEFARLPEPDNLKLAP